MATDIEAVIRNIGSCFDFTGKSVIHVGAGGGQFIGYAGRAREVLGVDPDPSAVERLKQAVREKGLEERFTVVQGDFLDVSARADVVFFEFCLHEIADPRAALRHAGTLAPETLIVDPAPGSSWSWYLCEEEKVPRGWAAAEEFRLALDRRFEGTQRFRDHAELVAKVRVQGDGAIERVQEFAARTDFTIDMPYRVALLVG